MRILSVSHAVFAATMVALGILGLIKGDFAAVFQPVPKSLPAREALAYLSAVILVASGMGLALEALHRPRCARASRLSRALVAVVESAPRISRAPTAQDSWSGVGEAGVMVAGAWVLYARFAADWDRQRLGFATGDRGQRIARVLLGLALIPFGVAHFFYLKETAALVPVWLPWHLGWAYFTGCAFLAGGVAVLIGVYARLAATLAALQIGLFTLLAWVPIVAAGSKSAFQWSETVISVALTAAVCVVADSYRGMPWLAMNVRIGC